MAYELDFSKLAGGGLPKLPKYAVDQIEAGLKELAQAPDTRGRPVVSPPFAPFGHQCDIRVRDKEGRLYNCIAFFLYSDCGKRLRIHRFVIQPMGHYKALADE